MSETIHRVVLRGRVQGVGFRAWAQDTALIFGLAGWVRNRRDGALEALFAGSAGAVADMVDACRKGPPGAMVSALEDVEAGPDALDLRRPGERFSMLPTA